MVDKIIKIGKEDIKKYCENDTNYSVDKRVVLLNTGEVNITMFQI